MATESNLAPSTEQNASESAQPMDRPDSGPPQQQVPRASAGPGAEGDIVVDIPQLAVDELNVELHAPILDQVKLEAKALNVGLFAKIELANVVALTGKRPASSPPDIEGRAEPSGGADERAPDEKRIAGVREELRDLADSAKEAYEEVSDRDLEEQVRELRDTARDAYARIAGDAGDGGGKGDGGGDGSRAENAGHAGRERAKSAGRRALDITKRGGKAAGLTAAGVAGAAALESVRHGGVKFQMPVQPGSKSGPKAVIDKVRDTIS
jgi:hypothetical protein